MNRGLLIIGDIHGNWGALHQAANRARDLGAVAVLAVGDLDATAVQLERLRIRGPLASPVWAIDGNHDDYLHWEDPDLHAASARMGLRLIRRGEAVVVDGITVGLLGGAAHVYERMQATNPEHHGVRPSDVAAALSAWRTTRPQIIVTHSVPSSVPIPALVPATGTTYGEPALASLKEGLGYAPEHWIFGHFHPARLVRHPAEGTTYWCLPKAERGSEALLLSGTTVQAVSLSF